MKKWSLYKAKLYTRYLFYKKSILLKFFKKGKSNSINFELSKNEKNGLEISVKAGCGLLCDYCPQKTYIESYKSKLIGEEKTLTEATFISVIRNVPTSTYMKWTGFTEPLESRLFPRFSQTLRDKEYKQMISTTLHGHPDSVDWFCDHLEYFDEITLHLPDDNQLMKSRVNEKYMSRLIRLLENASNFGLGEDRLVIFLIGDAFHKEIEALLTERLRQGLLDESQIHKAEVLNTRNSTINVDELNIKNVRIREFAKRDLNEQNKTYYCSYRRLNMGVLLPSGHVAICSQDYNLDFLLGNLKTEKLEYLYEKIESEPELSKKFLNGKFFPCIKCEHYKTIDTPFSGHLRAKSK